MQIAAISHDEFLAHKPLISEAAALLVEELAWYESDDKKVLGIVMRDRSDNDYSIVVMAHNEGAVRAVDMDVSFGSEDAAAKVLFDKMRAWAQGITYAD